MATVSPFMLKKGRSDENISVNHFWYMYTVCVKCAEKRYCNVHFVTLDRAPNTPVPAGVKT